MYISCTNINIRRRLLQDESLCAVLTIPFVDTKCSLIVCSLECGQSLLIPERN